jgi:hypothetical protein
MYCTKPRATGQIIDQQLPQTAYLLTRQLIPLHRPESDVLPLRNYPGVFWGWSEGFEDLYTELTLSLGTVRLNLHFVQRNGTIAEKVPALRQAFDSLVTAGGLPQKLHLSQNTINDDKRVSRAYKSHVEKLVEDFDSTFEAYSDESRVLSPVLEAMLNLESHPLAFMVQAGDDGHEDTATSGQSEHLASI